MILPGQSPQEKFQFVRDRIQAACDRSKRKFSDISLVAVTKGHSFDHIRPFLDLNINIIGENYLQDAETKLPSINDQFPSIKKHFIGHLQTNKAKKVLELFDSIHSVDSLKLINELDKRTNQLFEYNKDKFANYPVFVEINLSGDVTKSGCKPEEAFKLIQVLADETEHVKPIGLMTISPFDMVNEEDLHLFFKKMSSISEQIIDSFPFCKELSMGMSDDFEIAIEEGSTFVRIGTLLFGPRL